MSHASPEIRRVMRAERYAHRVETEIKRLRVPSERSKRIVRLTKELKKELQDEIGERTAEWIIWKKRQS